MVSGLVTSPWDQLRIFSGEAKLMRMASKSAMVFCISNGLERNKVLLRFLLSSGTGYRVRTEDRVFVSRDSRAAMRGTLLLQTCLRVRLASKYRFTIGTRCQVLVLGTAFSLLPRWPWAFSPRP